MPPPITAMAAYDATAPAPATTPYSPVSGGATVDNGGIVPQLGAGASPMGLGIPFSYQEAAASPFAAPAPAPVAPGADVEPQGASFRGEAVNSPMVGTFYRSPAPGAKSFVEVGDTVKQGDTVCIVEAMKLMNEIEAEVNGTIVKVLVENGQLVEYGQPLFLVKTT